MLGVAIAASVSQLPRVKLPRSTLTTSAAPQNLDHPAAPHRLFVPPNPHSRALQQNLRLIRPFEIEQAHRCDDRENKFRMWHEGGRLHRRSMTRLMPAQVPAGPRAASRATG